MTTVSDAASGQASEVRYKCRCGGFLLRSRDRRGVIRDVLCGSCRRRVTIFLGGRRSSAARAEDEDWSG